jgi:hypothetical protein
MTRRSLAPMAAALLLTGAAAAQAQTPWYRSEGARTTPSARPFT